MSIHHERYRARRARERSLGYLTLFVSIVFVTLLGMILAFYFLPDPALLFGAGDERKDGLVDVRIEDMEFRFSERHLERVNRGLLRGASQVDLRLPWPYDDRLATDRRPPAAAGGVVLASILPRGDQITPEERFAPIYKVYVDGGGRDASGLTNYRFKPDSPYADSELFVDETGVPPTVIRCDLKPSVLGPVLCERIRRLGERLFLRVRFDRARLDEWRAIDEAVAAIVRGAVKPP